MTTTASDRALDQALRLVSRGYCNYVAHHADPVRRAGDEEVRDFFARAAEEDLGLEDALIALLSERGVHGGPGSHDLHYGGYNFLHYTRLLDYAVEKELPAELAAAKAAQASATASDAAAASLIRWIAQTKEDQLKRATALRERLRAPARA